MKVITANSFHWSTHRKIDNKQFVSFLCRACVHTARADRYFDNHSERKHTSNRLYAKWFGAVFFCSLMCICSLFEYKQSTSHQIAYELNFHKFMAEFSIEFRFFDPFSICAQFLCVFRVIPMKNASTQKE